VKGNALGPTNSTRQNSQKFLSASVCLSCSQQVLLGFQFQHCYQPISIGGANSIPSLTIAYCLKHAFLFHIGVAVVVGTVKNGR